MKLTYEDVFESFVMICDVLSDSVDMIQAGGGNASAKYDSKKGTEMLIKASGFLMSEVNRSRGYTTVNLKDIRDILEDITLGKLDIGAETEINLRIEKANLGHLRPSIETFLHALLPQRYILHVHALTTLIYVSSKKFIDDLNQQWQLEADDSNQALLIPYEKPGVQLALAMMRGTIKYQEKYNRAPSVILLQNHGLIVASDSPEELTDLIKAQESIVKRVMKLSSNFDKPYRDQNIIKKALREVFYDKRLFVRRCEDKDLINFIDGKPSFPDALVFCGLKTLVAESEIELNSNIIAYKESALDFPKVIMFDNTLYFCGESIRKCLEVQDVLKIQNILRIELGDDLVTLTDEETYTLLNWEAEKYRKQL